MIRDDLLKLKRRIEEAEGPDREIDCVFVKLAFGVNPYPTAFAERDWEFYTDDEPVRTVPPYTASLDAALALVERVVLPGWGYALMRLPSAMPAHIIACLSNADHKTFSGTNAEPALAVLSALVSALAQEAGG